MIKKTTARSLRVACNAVIGVLDEAEAGDLSKIDLPAIFRRYENLNSMVAKPATMKVYRRRVNYAVEEFLKYIEDPTSWKPSGGQRASSTKVPRKLGQNGYSGESDGNRSNGTSKNQTDEASKISHRFPLRRDVFVTISGIPFDVSKPEMARLTAFMSNLVPSSEEIGTAQAMLNSSPEAVE